MVRIAQAQTVLKSMGGKKAIQDNKKKYMFLLRTDKDKMNKRRDYLGKMYTDIYLTETAHMFNYYFLLFS